MNQIRVLIFYASHSEHSIFKGLSYTYSLTFVLSARPATVYAHPLFSNILKIGNGHFTDNKELR